MACQAGAYGRTGQPGKGAFGWLWRVREAGRRDGVSVTSLVTAATESGSELLVSFKPEEI